MIVAANHVGDAHIEIVGDHAEIVGGRAVGAGDDEVVERGIGDGDFAFYQVVPNGYAVNRGFEADNGSRPAGISGRVLPTSGRQRRS